MTGELHINGDTWSLPSETCTLYRLVDLASRTLRQCAPVRGHPATRYADFLAGMTKIITTESMLTGNQSSSDSDALAARGSMWDQDWVNLWQDSGLDQNWLFASVGDAS